MKKMPEREMEVLLVEDNANDAELALRELKKRRLVNKLTWVKDGVEAVNYIFGSNGSRGKKIKQRPKVILLDLKLPKIDGLEVLQKLKEDERTRVIPVVILTSSREESDLVKSYKLGVNSYVVKPINSDDFSKAVADLGMYWMLLNQVPFTPNTENGNGSK